VAVVPVHAPRLQHAQHEVVLAGRADVVHDLLLHGQGRSEALRSTQLAMLAANRAREGDALPFSGEWR